MSKISDDLKALGFHDLAQAWEKSLSDSPTIRVLKNRKPPIKAYREPPQLRLIIGGKDVSDFVAGEISHCK